MRQLALMSSVAVAIVYAACGGAGHGASTPSEDTGSATSIGSQAAACSPARPHATGESTETMQSGGLSRAYLLRVPAGYDGLRALPLVLLLHGFGTDGRFISGYANLSAIADAKSFVVAAPDSLGTPQRWNAPRGISDADDVGFLTSLVRQIQDQLCIDPSMTFVAGYSNGGGMARLLACEAPDLFAAIAIVAGTYVPCTGDVPMIAFHGLSDPVVPFEGGALTPDRGGVSLPPVRRAVSEWAKALGCDGLATLSRPATDVELSTYHRCGQGDGEALLYSVIGGGHSWPGATDLPNSIVGATTHQIDATALIWEFFAARPKSR